MLLRKISLIKLLYINNITGKKKNIGHEILILMRH